MKYSINDLALFDGPVAFAEGRYVGRPNIGDRDRFLHRINQVFDNQWLTNMGPLMYEFEERIAELAGVEHCVAVNNATAGLHMVLRGCPPGSEVIVPSLSFVATAHVVRWMGLRPRFCDVDPATGLLDPALVEAAITDQTSAIIGVHLWGQPCDVDALARVADRHGLRLFYDAAHAVGCTSGDRPLGGFGDAEVFSFHATKVVNSFEGGAVLTRDGDLAHRLRAMRNFGFGPSGAVELVGTNAKMSEASAAMGLTSLETLGETIRHNRILRDAYRRCLADVPGVGVLRYDPANRNNFHYLIVEVDPDITGLHRDVLLDVLRAEKVMAQPYFSPAIHQTSPYRGSAHRLLPHTEALCARVLALPTGRTVSVEDVETVCDIIRVAATQGSEVTGRRLGHTAGVAA